MIECPYFILARRAIIDARSSQLSVVDVVDGLNFSSNVHKLKLEEGKHKSLLVPLDPVVEMIVGVRRSEDIEPGIYPLELAAFLPDGAEGMDRHTIQANLTGGDVTRVLVTLKSLAIREDGIYRFSALEPETERVLQTASMIVRFVDADN